MEASLYKGTQYSALYYVYYVKISINNFFLSLFALPLLSNRTFLLNLQNTDYTNLLTIKKLC